MTQHYVTISHKIQTPLSPKKTQKTTSIIPFLLRCLKINMYIFLDQPQYPIWQKNMFYQKSKLHVISWKKLLLENCVFFVMKLEIVAISSNLFFLLFSSFFGMTIIKCIYSSQGFQLTLAQWGQIFSKITFEFWSTVTLLD